VNGRDGAGNTALIPSVKEGLNELVHYLLSVDAAEPNVRNHYSLSVIQIAIECGNTGSLQTLLANRSASMKCKATTVIKFAQGESSTYTC
jgi:ankyrin repeat protein